MMLGIDHVVILVNDLDAACEDYAALGFTVVPGGEHADGATHNALIAFADGSYLELLAFRQPSPDHRWWRHVEIGEGLIDWALLPDNISRALATIREQGTPFEGPVPGGRQRPDGREIAWQMGIPSTPHLPFLCADVTPRSLRVPEGPARQHANQVTGIANVTVAVSDIAARIATYRGLLAVSLRGQSSTVQASPPHLVTPEAGARIAIFPVGNAIITLAEPARQPAHGAIEEAAPAEGTFPTLRAHLERRGDGPYALTLRTTSSSHAGCLEPARTHGVRLELVAG
jgi:catechol 2,3-dioxygenase-like lactoylglutathione lyase family enzyme